jgi:hypothetical protein
MMAEAEAEAEVAEAVAVAVAAAVVEAVAAAAVVEEAAADLRLPPATPSHSRARCGWWPCAETCLRSRQR